MTMKNSDASTKTDGSAAQEVDRRDFVKAAAAVGATGSIAGLAMPVWGAAPAGDRLKVGLVGCGGRGTGAANQASNAEPGVRRWARGEGEGREATSPCICSPRPALFSTVSYRPGDARAVLWLGEPCARRAELQS